MKKKRRKKTKLSNYLMLVLLLLVFYYLFTKMISTEISAEELARYYSTDVESADTEFLNKEIELTGKVKAYFDFDDNSDFLEIISENASISIFCILSEDVHKKKAEDLTQGTEITIKGRCLGLAEYKFPNSVYVSVIRLN